MKVYVFGNRDVEEDKLAFEVVDALRRYTASRSRRIPPVREPVALEDDRLDPEILSSLSKIEFVEVKPNEDLPFVGEERVVILDVVDGISKVTVFTEKDLDKLTLPPRTSAHEYDLGFQLRYLKKIGKLKEVRIVGLPMNKGIDLALVRLELEKF